MDVEEESVVTLTSASILSIEDLPISSVYNIFRHPVHVKLWVKILCRSLMNSKSIIIPL